MKTLEEKRLKDIALAVILSIIFIFATQCFYGCQTKLFELVLSSNNYEYGEVYGNGKYKQGEEVTIRAVPKEGYEFTDWDDGSVEPTRIIKITKDTTLIANFEKKKNFLVDSFNPELYNPEDYQRNIQDVLKENFNISDINAQTNWLDFTNSKCPNDVSLVDNYLLANYNLMLAENYIINGQGTSESIATSQVRDYRQSNGRIYGWDYSSKGMLSLKKVLTYDKQTNCGSLSDKPTTTLSEEDLLTLYGISPLALNSIIVSEKTLLSSERVFDSVNNKYKITLHLNPLYSALHYYKEVKYKNGFEQDPEFLDILITFEIDKQWNFISAQVRTNFWAVKFGLPNKVSELIDYTFDFESEVPEWEY